MDMSAGSVFADARPTLDPSQAGIKDRAGLAAPPPHEHNLLRPPLPQANAPHEPIETSLQGTGDGTTDNLGRPPLPSQTFFVDRRYLELARPHTPSIHAPDMFRGTAILSRFAILRDDFPGIDM
ncbi:hypothetical protein NW754_016747 [Fusarium falciforme]|nr:hypothetical protein NW754_016747 [Fusarium falciforme]